MSESENQTTTANAPGFDRDAVFEGTLTELRAADPEPVAHFVDGEELAEGEVIWREDPCHPASTVSGCYDASQQVVAAALDAARRAAPAWTALGGVGRAERMRAAARLLDEERLTRIAATIALETGKSRAEGMIEAEELKVLLERYADIAAAPDSFADPLVPGHPKLRSESVLRPYGVFGVIAPFNYPTVQGAGPAIAALLAGNTVVMKPAHLGPRSAHEFIELMRECDLPPGVVNMVHGGDEPGKALVSGGPDGMVFTGSHAAGMSILRAMQSGAFPRPVVSEMGGSNPVIVTETADLVRAADGIAISAFGLSGQRCTACSRAVVVDEVHDEFVDLLARRTAELVVGDPIDRDVFTGPLIARNVVADFDSVIGRAYEDGTIAAGGGHVADRGYCVEPTVIADLPRGHELTREELFMPVLTVTRATDFDDAVREANDTNLGLTAGIYTGSADEARAYLTRAEAGCVDVNVPGAATTGWWPGNQTFGGWKGSGSTGKQAFGRWYVQQFGRQRCQSVATDFEL